MRTYKTPNVYVEEVATLPPSVVPVATAIPAFIGYTEKAGNNNEYKLQPIRISSLLDYTTYFGGAYPTPFTATLDGNQQITKIQSSATDIPAYIPDYLMYYAVRLFFDNGGGPCYIISVGNYSSGSNKITKADFEGGLAALRKEDEPTLILLTDAVNLAANDYHVLCQSALKQCEDLKDRFAIFDVLASDKGRPTKAIGTDFRQGIGAKSLKYGAAYYPYLQTSLSSHYTDDSVILIDPVVTSEYTGLSGLYITHTGLPSDKPQVEVTVNDPSTTVTVTKGVLVINVPTAGGATGTQIVAAATSTGKYKVTAGVNPTTLITNALPPTALSRIVTREYSTGPNGLLITHTGIQADNPEVQVTVGGESLTVTIDSGVLVINVPTAGETVDKIVAAATTRTGKYEVTAAGDANTLIKTKLDKTSLSPAKTSLTSVKTEKTELYNRIKAALSAIRVQLPPSSAVAGVYETVDRERGVWKAPANVSLASVIGPTVKITNKEQDDLNVHSTGKSINAIRSFTGKGTLIWGARTLAGSDTEWSYISVRRLFNLIEESIQKATNFVVFESNSAITWLKVKTLAETYLEGLWRQGALAGATPEEAFFVNVGLGQTMTEQDILAGRMIIEIGVSAVRPAEFIVLRFSHKLQQA